MSHSLYLVRHAETEPSNQPVELWPLSEAGREQATKLAGQPFWEDVDLICTSLEPKALQTVQIVRERHDLPMEPAFDLHELRRPSGPIADYAEAVRQALANPAASVHGWEPAGEAQTRILVAIERLLMLHEEMSIAVVSHGLVLSLYLAHLIGTEPSLELWRSIPFASAIQVDVEAGKIVARYEI